MADIRIKDLAVTASSSASDDYLAVDGSTNGTRKLSAYSPTFGGNLTVSGAGTTGGNLSVRNALGYATGIHSGTTADSTQQLLLSTNAAYNHAYISKGSTTLGIGFSSDNSSFVADDSITITAATKLVTLAGNLTVSGGTISSGAGNDLTLQQVNYGGGLTALASGQVKIAAFNGQSVRLQTQGADALTLDSSQNATFAGNIKTAAPSGGTAATWRLGTVASVSPTSPNRTIEVEIGGTTYYIHAKTTNN